MTIDPKDASIKKMHGYLLGAVAPRPIAFASSIDRGGNVNLSPFSFFNCFGANPPILVFSPSRRGRDNTTKHTYENVLEVPEVVINIVSYGMVEQTSLASTEYARGINEFEKAGFTAIPSEKVAPPRVGESPAAFECKVLEIKPLGKEGGAGNLVICEVVLAHLKDEVLDEGGAIDPYKLDAVARMGGNWYCRAQGEALFQIPKPLTTHGMGVGQLPEHIKNSTVLTGNDLGRLGNTEALPSKAEIKAYAQNDEVLKVFLKSIDVTTDLHRLAQQYLRKGEVNTAWKILLQEI